MAFQGGRLVRVGVGALGLALALLNVNRRGGESCRECLSSRGYSEWRVGAPLWGSLLVLPRFVGELRPSRYALDQGLSEHEHDWRGGGYSESVLFGTTVVAYSCGGPSVGRAAIAYERDETFHAIVRSKYDRGEISADALRDLIVVEERDRREATRRLDAALFDELVEREGAR